MHHIIINIFYLIHEVNSHHLLIIILQSSQQHVGKTIKKISKYQYEEFQNSTIIAVAKYNRNKLSAENNVIYIFSPDNNQHLNLSDNNFLISIDL